MAVGTASEYYRIYANDSMPTNLHTWHKLQHATNVTSTPHGTFPNAARMAVFMVVGVSHPDPNGPPDVTPIEVGEVWENPVSGERATIVELPHANRDGRCVVDLTALVGRSCWRGTPAPGIGRAIYCVGGRADSEARWADGRSRRGRSSHCRGGRLARLVERG